MNTEHNWAPIESFETIPATTFIYCDTRDFHILCTSGERISDELIKKMGAATDDNKFNRSEILGLLAGLEVDSGGKRDWRVLKMKNHPGWCKYIRFVCCGQTVDLGARVEPLYIAYIDRWDAFTLLKRSDFDKENLIID